MADISASERQEQEHDVHRDFVGIIIHKTRLTCYTPGCNGAAIIWQAHMSAEQWHVEREKFLTRHPATKIVGEGYRG